MALDRTILRVVMFAVLGVWLGEPAIALYDDSELPYCRNGGFANEGRDFAFYRVVATNAALLHDSEGFEKGCPDARNQACRNGELRQGEVLVTNKVRNGFVCAFVHHSAGWVPLEDVERLPQPSQAPPLSAWKGRWALFDDTIRISVSHGRLDAHGNGYWPGKHYKQEEGMPAQHFGGFDLSAVPSGNKAVFRDENDGETGCVVEATLFGKYLIVTDNSNCGALNVRFEGLFQKTPQRRKRS